MGEVEHSMDDRLYKAAARLQGAVGWRDILPSMDDEELSRQLTFADRSNVLHVAARCGNAGFISGVLGHVVSTDSHNKLLCMHNSKRETPLHLAAQFGHLDAVRALLVAHRVDELPCWMERDEKGDTPLHRALRSRCQDVALLLLERDVQMLSLDNNAGESPAYLAAYSLFGSFLARICNADRDGQCRVSFSGPFGQTAFHPATKIPGNTIMPLLIGRRNRLLKSQDNKGKTVLHYVVEGGKENKESMVETLLNSDSSLAYIHDNDGWTPLHKAASMGSLEMMNTILDLSPQSVDIRDKYNGKTALHVAKMDACFLAQCMKTRMTELINEIDNDGNTLLHLALMNADIKSVNALLQVKDINWSLVNKQGLSPMDLCDKNQYSFVQRLAPRNQSRYPIPTNLFKLYMDMESKTEKDLEQLLNSILVVAALLVTITFAALFTIPGGYNPNNGRVMLMYKSTSIRSFVTFDVGALFTGISVLFRYGYGIFFVRCRLEKQRKLVADSIVILFYSLVYTTLAFISGVYVVCDVTGATLLLISSGLLAFFPTIQTRWLGGAFWQRLRHKINTKWQAAINWF